MNYYRNLKRLYSESTTDEIALGANWYSTAAGQLDEIAKQHNFGFYEICLATAALSPNQRWEHNLFAVRLLAERVAAGLHDIPVGIGGYRVNIRKALRILMAAKRGESTKDILSGPKVQVFALNLWTSGANASVTIDSHAFSAACYTRYTSKQVPEITPKRHREVTAAYQKLADELKLNPPQLQAILWLTWKRKIKEEGLYRG